MKKIILLFIAILFVFFSACSPAPSTGNQSDIQADTLGLYFDNLSDYNCFVEEGYNSYGLPITLPDNFVYWEDISYMGKFRFLRLSIDCTHGYYSIEDNNGVDFLLYLDFQNGKNSQYKSKDYTSVNISENMDSMRKSMAYNKRTKIVRGEFEYRYDPWGDFSGIYWYKNGVEYHLGGGLGKYPPTQTPGLISKLLSLDETVANEAFSQIKQSLDAS